MHATFAALHRMATRRSKSMCLYIDSSPAQSARYELVHAADLEDYIRPAVLPQMAEIRALVT